MSAEPLTRAERERIAVEPHRWHFVNPRDIEATVAHLEKALLDIAESNTRSASMLKARARGALERKP